MLYSRRRLKNVLKLLLYRCFRSGQTLGVDVLPRHFYSEIPDLRLLETLAAWRAPYSMEGVRGASIDSQVEFLHSLFTPVIRDRVANNSIHPRACKTNGAEGFGRIEAAVLFAFVATHAPRRIVQIGAGVSTAVCVEAARFAGYKPEIECIDPYPTGFLRNAAEGREISLVESAVQDLDPARFASLKSGDLLFIDSTHTLGPAGEVSRLVLEVLPRLGPDIFVHFHDIVFPYDHNPGLLTGDLFFPHESVLLHAFLTLNNRYRIVTSLSMIHHRAPAAINDVLPFYVPRPMKQGLSSEDGDFPSSIYLLSSEAP